MGASGLYRALGDQAYGQNIEEFCILYAFFNPRSLNLFTCPTVCTWFSVLEEDKLNSNDKENVVNKNKHLLIIITSEIESDISDQCLSWFI